MNWLFNTLEWFFTFKCNQRTFLCLLCVFVCVKIAMCITEWPVYSADRNTNSKQFEETIGHHSFYYSIYFASILTPLVLWSPPSICVHCNYHGLGFFPRSIVAHIHPHSTKFCYDCIIDYRSRFYDTLILLVFSIDFLPTVVCCHCSLSSSSLLSFPWNENLDIVITTHNSSH